MNPNFFDPGIARVMDANLNRALEGLRTLEDLARFALDHHQWSAELKGLRHALVTACKVIPREVLLASRDVTNDVGAKTKTLQEGERSGLASLVAAASGRTQQSLRVLEECAKESFPQLAQVFENARYECYRIAAALEGCVANRERLQPANLYVLTDAAGSDQELFDRVAALSQAGVKIIQLREKNLEDAKLFYRAEHAVRAAREYQSMLIVNDRPDIAVAADAHGVHLGQTELPANAARAIVGRHRIVGISTHSLDDLKRAMSDGADYVGCGPTFRSTTKSFSDFAGLEYLRQAAQASTIPAYAIGGIDLSNLDQVIETGIRRIAISGAVARAKDPTSVVRQFQAKLQFALCCLLCLWIAVPPSLSGEPPSPVYLKESKVHESSGIAASQRNPNIFWTHNDSGDQAQLFAFDRDGNDVGRVRIRGAEAIDWEDMCSFLWQDDSWLMVADIGDNQAKRSEVVLYAFPEPDPKRDREVQVVKQWRVRYADGPRDCEAIAVDVSSRCILLLDKSLFPKTQLWSVPLEDTAGIVTATSQGSMPIPAVTSMDYHAESGRLLINTYADGILVTRQRNHKGDWEPWTHALQRPTQLVSLPKRKQGEAICFTTDGLEALLTSEGAPCPLWRLRLP